MEETQENGVTAPNGLNHYLKIHIQVKTKGVGGADEPAGRFSGKAQ